MINILPLRAFKDNYIWMISDADTPSVWVVDPGDAAPVIEMLSHKNQNLSGILLTHHHHDHSGGIADLLKSYGNIPVYGHYKSTINTINHPIKNNEVISISSFKLTAIEIPGHTLDHIAYYGNNVLFSGDTLFSAGCGRIFEGTPQQMYSSLQKLYQLPEQTKIYCGHEYTLANLQFAQYVEPNNFFITQKITALQHSDCTLPSILHEEKLTNPFLRCHVPEIIQAVSSHAGKILEDPVEVFYYLREWKNNFKM